jgi:Ankyrin repeats (many copies)
MWSPLRHSSIQHRPFIAISAFICILAGTSCHRTDRATTEFLHAAGNGDLAKTRMLLGSHPDLVSSRDRKGFTALHYAASYGYREIAELLVAKNADVNAKTSNGDTPLHYAAAYGFKDMAKLLLANGADIMPGIGIAPVARPCLTQPEVVAWKKPSCCWPPRPV